MRYGEIARKIREETNRLNSLADELERIESATPQIDGKAILPQGKMLISIKEASEVLGLSRPMVTQLTHRDDFPSVRIGSRILINVKKLQEWLDNQSEIWLD